MSASWTTPSSSAGGSYSGTATTVTVPTVSAVQRSAPADVERPRVEMLLELLEREAESARGHDEHVAATNRARVGVLHHQESAAMAVDPVCHMKVRAAEDAPHVTLQGHELFFCSDKCRDTFSQHPERYPVEPLAGSTKSH